MMIKVRCPICDKKFQITEWVEKKGLLKGKKIMKDIFCSKKCAKQFDLVIKFNIALENLNKIGRQLMKKKESERYGTKTQHQI